MIQFHPANPIRPVDWRWERARMFRENEDKLVISKKEEDDWTIQAYKFQKELVKCQTEFDNYMLLKKFADIYFAYMLRGNADDKKTLTMRSEIEARILAEEPDDRIAARCGCNEITVTLYEKLFFNVREKLKNTSYILHQVMGPAIHRGLYEREHDLLWKLYGYFCGSKVVDVLVTTFTNPIKPETPEQVESFFVDDTRSTMRRKAAMAARSIGVSERTQIRILETYAQFLAIEKETGAGQSESLILDNIKSMMDSLPFTTGIRAKKEANQLIVKYDDNHAELRTDETLLIGAGIETAEQMELSNIKFPEAPSDGQNK